MRIYRSCFECGTICFANAVNKSEVICKNQTPVGYLIIHDEVSEDEVIA
jgi:hypothetical protein